MRCSPGSALRRRRSCPSSTSFAPGFALLIAGWGSGRAMQQLIAPAREAAAAVRARHADPVRRAAADVRRGAPRGGSRLREGALPRRAHRRRRSRSSPTICRARPRRCRSCPIFPLGGAYAASTTTTRHSVAAARRVSCSTSPPSARRPKLPTLRRAWVRSFWEALLPHASGSGQLRQLHGRVDEDRVRASYGAGQVRPARAHQGRRTTRTTSSTATRTSSPKPPWPERRPRSILDSRRVSCSATSYGAARRHVIALSSLQNHRRNAGNDEKPTCRTPLAAGPVLRARHDVGRRQPGGARPRALTAKAHKRAMPIERLAGNGMSEADARALHLHVDEGVDLARGGRAAG